MAHGHDHGHGHMHGPDGADRTRLTVALCLIVALMGVEVAAGVVAGSLALLADAGHMLTDAGALLFAVVAAAMATRPAQGSWTFGFRRLEILAAQVNGITLGLVALWIVYEAVRRLISPDDVQGGIVLVVAAGGLAVNLVATAVLHGADRESLNVRGAYLHVATDAAAFAASGVAGALVLLTGWDRFDPLASLAVAGLMIAASVSLLAASTRIFLERAPGDIDPDEVGRALVGEEGVVEVHDLHVWTVTSGFPALSAHVLVNVGTDCHAARRRLEGVLVERFGLDHTTLQVDHAGSEQPEPVELGEPFRRRTPL